MKELEWMTARKKPRRGRKQTFSLFQNPREGMPRWPRGPDGRGSWRKAGALVDAGLLKTTLDIADVAA